MYNVEIVADSVMPRGHRLTSMLVTMPRIILAELNTHRMLSRNSASSRAIPFPKMLRSVMEKPFIPLKWQKDHSGMQGTEYYDPTDVFEFDDVAGYLFHRFKFKDGNDADFTTISNLLIRIMNKPEFQGTRTLTEWWLLIRDKVVECAALMFCFNVTKQVVNRLLEPFMWHTVLISATEWENFYAQRVHPAAEIHMEHIAALMLEAMNASKPRVVEPGQWHVPFFVKIPTEDINAYLQTPLGQVHPRFWEVVCKVSTMMNARTSYTTPGDDLSEWTIEKYLEKFDLLLASGHWSCFEHCAQAMTDLEYWTSVRGVLSGDQDNYGFYHHEYYPFIVKPVFEDDPEPITGVNQHNGDRYGWSGNFRGFIQYRKMFPNENRSDERLIQELVLS